MSEVAIWLVKEITTNRINDSLNINSHGGCNMICFIVYGCILEDIIVSSKLRQRDEKIFSGRIIFQD